MQVVGMEDPMFAGHFCLASRVIPTVVLILTQRLVTNFEVLGDQFLTHFVGSLKPKKHFIHLASIRQKKWESLRNYLTRWQKEMQCVEGLDDKAALTLFVESLRSDGQCIRLHDEARGLTPKPFKEPISWLTTRKPSNKGSRMCKPMHEVRDLLPPSSPVDWDIILKLSIPSSPRMAILSVSSYEYPHHYGVHYLEKGNCGAHHVRAGDPPNQWRRLGLPLQSGQATRPTNHPAKKGKQPAIEEEDDRNWWHKPVINMIGTVVRRVLLDTDNIANVLYLETSRKLSLHKDQLRLIRTPLAGFTVDSINTEGSILLEVELHVWKISMGFVVVGLECMHNFILGWPGLEDLGALIYVKHLYMKFRTPTGVGTVRYDKKKWQGAVIYKPIVV
nr:uncharacterized protein LOC109157529 [Ipomoea batatas]